jgi:hypothetical protein
LAEKYRWTDGPKYRKILPDGSDFRSKSLEIPAETGILPDSNRKVQESHAWHMSNFAFVIIKDNVKAEITMAIDPHEDMVSKSRSNVLGSSTIILKSLT